MNSIDLTNFSGKIVVYANLFRNHFQCSLLKKAELGIILGSVSDGNIEENIKICKSWLNGSTKYILSAGDLKYLSDNEFNSETQDNCAWLENQLVSMSVMFTTFTKFFFCYGGIDPLQKNKKWPELCGEPQLAFEPKTNGDKKWHDLYGGEFGYGFSFLPESNGIGTRRNACATGMPNRSTIVYINNSGIESVSTVLDPNEEEF